MGNNIALTIEDDVYYKAKFQKNPFAYGASRAAYKGKLVAPRQQAGQQVVVKKFKREYAMHRTDWKTELEISKKAEELAQEFNNITGTSRPIHFVQPITMVVTDTPWLGCTACMEGEWVVAEGQIPGKYTKWTSNAGWVNDAEMGGGGSLLAFSHWTWVKTNGEMVVCDLQGARYDNPMIYLLTDPAINSCSEKYGNTDLGQFGITTFFQSHRCTQFCRDLGLAGNIPPPEMNPLNVFLSMLLAPRRSTSYSGIVQKAKQYIIAELAVVEEDSNEDETENSSEQEEIGDSQNSYDDSELEQDSELDEESEDNELQDSDKEVSSSYGCEEGLNIPHIDEIGIEGILNDMKIGGECSNEDETENSGEQEETSDSQNGDDDSEFELDSELDEESEDNDSELQDGDSLNSNDDSELDEERGDSDEERDSDELRIDNEQEQTRSVQDRNDNSELEQDSECGEESEFYDESELQDSDEEVRSSDGCGKGTLHSQNDGETSEIDTEGILMAMKNGDEVNERRYSQTLPPH